MRTVIADIAETMLAQRKVVAATPRQDRHRLPTREQRHLWHREIEQRRHAVQLFAELNGWKRTIKDFGPQDIGKRNSAWRQLPHDVFDHCEYFRAHGHNTAIVAQPYEDTRADAAAMAAAHGVALFVPPNAQASFWYPKWTYCFVFCACDHVMRWLPEQELPYALPDAPLRSADVQDPQQ